MSSKHDFLVVQDGPKMIHLEQLLSHFCQNLHPEIIDTKCKWQVFMDRQKVTQKSIFVINFVGFFRSLVGKKTVFVVTFLYLFNKLLQFSFCQWLSSNTLVTRVLQARLAAKKTKPRSGDLWMLAVSIDHDWVIRDSVWPYMYKFDLIRAKFRG